MLIAAAAAWYLQAADAAVPSVRVLPNLPDTIGGWVKVEDITFEKRIFEILGTQQVFSRVYRDAEQRTVEVIIVQAVNNRSAFHPPEYCLTGTGSEIVARGRKIIDIPAAQQRQLHVNEMTLVSGTRGKYLVWNWYAAGSRMTASFYRQQIQLVGDQIFSRHALGTAVNLYTDIANNDAHAAAAANADIARHLIPQIEPYL
jgi:EpsI family protein